MSFRMTIARKGMIVVSVPLLFQFLLVCGLATLLHFSQEDSARLAQSRTFVAGVDDLNRDFLNLGMSLAAFRYSRGDKFIKQYDKIVGSMPDKFEQLKKLSANYPSRLRHVERLQQCGKNVIEMTQSFKRPADTAIVYLIDPLAYRQKISEAFSQFMVEASAVTREEVQLQATSPASEATMRQALTWFIGVSLTVSTLISVFLTRFFTTNITSRLAILTRNNLRFSQKQQLLPPLSGGDEIADLDRNFHKMVGLIQEAENHRQLYIKMLSHDLRAPLTSMLATLEAAARGLYGQVSEKGLKRFEAAQNDSGRLLSLINEMIDYDGLADGTLELDKEVFEARDLMVAARDSLESLADGKQVKLEFSCDDVGLNADKERLKRVVINLIHNAVKFSPRQALVRTEAKARDGMLLVRITDQGPGLNRDEIDNLFQPFGKGQSEQSGSGLGLAICKMIVEAHGGALGVDSQPGQGACFWFELPTA